MSTAQAENKMSDSSGDECALQIDIDGGDDSARAGGRGRKDTGKKTKGGWKHGDVVWAKVTGFNYWPAKVFDAVNDSLVPDWLKQPPRPTYILVRFFGTYDMQWVSSNSAESYEKGLKKKFHNKSKRKVFLKALKEVRSFLDEGVVPEGLTIRPADPPELEETSTAPSENITEDPSHTHTTQSFATNNTYTCTITDPQSNPPSRSSRRRKGSTPRRLSSSSSLHSTDAGDIACPSDSKKIKLDDFSEPPVEMGLGDGVQAFTCAPLPLSSAVGQK